MVSHLLSKDTRYRLMLQDFYFNKTNSTQNAPDVNASVSGPDNKMKKATKFEKYCKFPERNSILQFDSNTVSRFSCHANCALLLLVCGPGSSVGIATDYGLDGPGIESRWGRDFTHLSRPTLGPTQHPVQWVPGLSRR